METNPGTRLCGMGFPNNETECCLPGRIYMLGNSLTRVPPLPERGLGQLARANPNAMRPEAAAFFEGGRFSAVRTLSPRSTALIAVSELPIEVPYHSVIGQRHPGPKERGSDGVVPYWSSHLPGAQSELIVRSGHGVIDNPDAIREVIRILRLEQRPKQHGPVKHRIANGVSMREAGIDICGHRSKSVKEFDGQKFDHAITVCDSARESCPVFSARQNSLMRPIAYRWPASKPSAYFLFRCVPVAAAASFAHCQNFSVARLSRPLRAAMPTEMGFGSGVRRKSFTRFPRL
jgi:hypothetical protein